jgi:hypothetical protein
MVSAEQITIVINIGLSRFFTASRLKMMLNRDVRKTAHEARNKALCNENSL